MICFIATATFFLLLTLFFAHPAPALVKALGLAQHVAYYFHDAPENAGAATSELHGLNVLFKLGLLAPKPPPFSLKDPARWQAIADTSRSVLNRERLLKLRLPLEHGATTRVARLPVDELRRHTWVLAAGVRNESTDPVVLHLHGGGCVAGTSALYEGFMERLSRITHTRVFSYDYLLAPEHAIDEAVDDVIRNALTPLAAARSIALVGDSCGGLMSLLVLQRARDRGDAPMPAAAVLLSPMSDLSRARSQSLTPKQGERDAMLELEQLTRFAQVISAAATRGATDASDDPAHSPLAGSFAGLPPLLFMVGGEELLLHDAVLAAQKAHADGVERVELEVRRHVPHVYPLFAGLIDEGSEGLGRMAGFIAPFLHPLNFEIDSFM